MNILLTRLGALLVLGSLCGACTSEIIDDNDPEALLESTDSVVANNGLSYNGLSYNGLSYNGLSYNGLSYNGLSYNGVELVGTTLKGVRQDGSPVSGAGLIGSTLIADLSDGSQITLTIDNVKPSSTSGLLLYTLSYADGTTICGLDSGGLPIPAIPLSGRWDYSVGTATGGDHIDDPSMFTLACVSATLAKCVTLGYRPWETVREEKKGGSQEIPLSALHQACTRMLRADYCGDGVGHTQNGTPVNIWDNFKTQRRVEVSGDWRMDAEWTPEGAVCIQGLRYDVGGVGTAYINAHCPERWTTSFPCFGSTSTFFTATGYATPLPSRSLVRNEFNFTYASMP